MTYELTLILTNQAAILERILQVIRYRRFELLYLQVHHSDNHRMQVSIKVASQQPINHLITQLNKLYDVESLTCQQKTQLRQTA